jgi:hypothetical protein
VEVVLGATQTLRSMGFTDEKFPAGTHMCLIYDDDGERRKLVARFLDAGLRGGEKVAYFADVVTPDEVRAWLAGMGVELPGNGGAAQFHVSEARTTYCPEGAFVPDRMLDTLRAFHRTTCDEGYPGSRVSGEMSWALRGIPGSDRLMEYEALVNDVLVAHPITAICQYDARRFDGKLIFDVLKVHPMMVVNGMIVRNPYYLRPQEFLGRAS